MVIYYAEKDPDAWKTAPTWDSTPVMCKSFEPVSFVLNRPLKRPDPVNEPDPEAQPKAMSLPPVKCLPLPTVPISHATKRNQFASYNASILIVEKIPYWEIDGDLVECNHERHTGVQSTYPRPYPVPGLTKPPRGRRVPTKESKERKGTTYPCWICRRAFKRSDHLKRHVRSVHMHMENTYLCSLPVCMKSFARRDNLIQHSRKHRLFGAMHDCTKNFDGELFPAYLPHDAEPALLEAARNYIPPWLNGQFGQEDNEDHDKYANGENTCDDDWLPIGTHYETIRQDKLVAETLAVRKEEAERSKAAFEAAFKPPPVIGTARNIPLRLQPPFPADFYYGGVVPSGSSGQRTESTPA